MEFFDNMDPVLRAFWFTAIPVSVVFIIQTIMTFMGGDVSDGVDADFDGDLEHSSSPFQLFSLRNLINFLLGFSWTGISFYTTISNPILLVSLAVVIGVVFVLFFFFVIKQLQKLAEDNSFKMAETINKTAEVYLSIPGGRSGRGKVLISVRGSVRELDAMTEKEKIETGSVVTVVKIENDNILFVEKV